MWNIQASITYTPANIMKSENKVEEKLLKNEQTK